MEVKEVKMEIIPNKLPLISEKDKIEKQKIKYQIKKLVT